MAELSADGVDIRRADRKIYFWITRGWLDDPAEVRPTEDVIIPSRSGRFEMNRVADTRRIELRGQVAGASDAEFLALVQTLPFFDRTLSPWPLVVGDQYRGLAALQTATINVRSVNIVPEANALSWRRLYSVELESIDSPPEWVIA